MAPEAELKDTEDRLRIVWGMVPMTPSGNRGSIPSAPRALLAYGRAMNDTQIAPPVGDVRATPESAVESLLKWAGLAFLFAAVAIAMNLARSAGWFTPEVRVVAGLALAAVLLGVGLRIGGRRPLFSQALEGGGLAIAYLTLIGGHAALGVVPSNLAIGGAVVVTIVAFAIARWQRHSMLAVVGVLGGLSAPFLLGGGGAASANEGDAVGLALYVAVLMLSAIVVWYDEGWATLLVSAASGGAAGMLIVVDRVMTGGSDRIAVQGAIVVVALAYWLVPVVRHLTGRPVGLSSLRLERQLAPLMGPIEARTVTAVPPGALLISTLVWEGTPTMWGAVTIVVAVVVAAVGLPLPAGGVRTAHFATGSALAALGVVLMVEGPALVVLLAGQGLALWWVGMRSVTPAYEVQATVVGAVVGAMIVVDLMLYLPSGGAGVGVVAAHAVVTVMATGIAAVEIRPVPRAVVGLGGYVLMLLLPIEIVDGTGWGGFAQTMWWVGVAIVVLSVALRLARPTLARVAAITLAAAVAKLVAADLFVMGAVERIALLVGVGAGLLVFSYHAAGLWRLAAGQWRDVPTPRQPV